MTIPSWLNLGPGVVWPVTLILAQVSGVLLIAWACATLPKRKTAATRHAIWLAAMGGVLIGPIVLVALHASGASFVVFRLPIPADTPFRAVSTPSDPHRDLINSNMRSLPIRQHVLERRSESPTPAPAVSRFEWPRWPVLGGIALGFWAMGTALLLGWLAYGLAALARERRRARPIVETRLHTMSTGIASELGLSTTPKLLASERLSGPMAAGIRHPAILLPSPLIPDIDDDQLRDILVHETAHLARRDPLVGLLQRIAVAVFWPHPLIHMMNREISRSREEICDNHVLRLGNRARYARTLLDLAESLRGAPRAMVATGLLPSRWSLADRVVGLMDERRDLMVHVQRGKRGALAALMLVAAAPFCLLGAQTPTEAAKPATPTADAVPPAAAAESGPITPQEIAGRVVDAEGRPVEGAKVMAWSWVPAHTTHTDRDGRFRFRPFDRPAADPQEGAELRVVREGYASREFPEIKGGTGDLVVTLSNTTYFEGNVIDPSGRPAPDVLIRASHPFMRDGNEVGRYWSETRSDAQGHYRLHVPAATFDVQVRAPGVGVLRQTEVAIAADSVRTLDLRLERGVAFRARITDSVSGKPVAGVRLWAWQHPGIEARSDHDGIAALDDMLPGLFEFQVESPGTKMVGMGEVQLLGAGPWYARWWSEQAVSEWSRRQIHRDWQRNFDGLDFNLTPGMEPVEVVVEEGVVVRGRVLDPTGNPVAGATVAPALTGTGNSLTGDTRFSVATGPDGRYEVLLPASHNRDYNLVAHDGAYGEWRHWANGIIDPFRTKPGERLDNIDIRLTRPATVRGRVLDANGQPVANRQVRASAADTKENRYYDPTTTTDAEGRFDLKFIRPSEQHIQVYPFWLQANQAPGGTSQTITLKPGEVREGITLTAQPQ